jgi:hypothetical protein
MTRSPSAGFRAQIAVETNGHNILLQDRAVKTTVRQCSIEQDAVKFSLAVAAFFSTRLIACGAS